jgi:kynureninase
MARKDHFKSSVSQLHNATDKAFKGVHGIIGDSRNPNVRLYESLTPEHFKRFTDMYGEESVMNYIKQMEYERLEEE